MVGAVNFVITVCRLQEVAIDARVNDFIVAVAVVYKVATPEGNVSTGKVPRLQPGLAAFDRQIPQVDIPVLSVNRYSSEVDPVNRDVAASRLNRSGELGSFRDGNRNYIRTAIASPDSPVNGLHLLNRHQLVGNGCFRLQSTASLIAHLELTTGPNPDIRRSGVNVHAVTELVRH